MEDNSTQGIWDHIADEMLLEFAESGCPIFRATTPLSRGKLKSKGHGKLSIHFTADQKTIETIFRIIVCAGWTARQLGLRVNLGLQGSCIKVPEKRLPRGYHMW